MSANWQSNTNVYRLTTFAVWLAVSLAIGFTALADWRISNELDEYGFTGKPSPPTESNNKLTPHVFDVKPMAQLFGVVQVKPSTPEAKPVKNIPLTRLNLRLIGTFSHSDHKSASALIADGSKPSKRYFGGETVPGGAELVGVTRNSVVLRRNGRDEVLLFPRISPDIKSIQNQALARQPDKEAHTGSDTDQSIVARKQLANDSPTIDSATSNSVAAPDITPVLASTATSRDELKERLKRLRDRK
ncbi:hypothetical protein KFE80_07415 [bacterium SCSIO 12696]|nr:hypothetical protein KFE80_07415 [bacterium SCSIO 12696]